MKVVLDYILHILYLYNGKFLTNRGTQLVMFGVENSGSNWYKSFRHLETQLTQFLDRGT
jgi:hypothetical protein